MKELNITSKEENQRIDKYLQKYFNAAPKSLIYKLIRKKKIKLNGSRIEGSEILCCGDIIKIYLSEETMESFMELKVINKRAGKIDVIYEDDNILVCNKPVGMLSHPESSEDKDTLIDRILFYLYEKNEFNINKESTFTPAICNRLDRNTSGIVICGKNLISVQSLNKMFLERKVDKYYTAMVKGEIKTKGILEGYHTKDSSQNKVCISKEEVENSSKVLTEYKPIKSNKGFTLLEIKLITGKSHQIRAHLKSMDTPVVGDIKYGDRSVNEFVRRKIGVRSQLLHAERIILKEKEGHLSYMCNKEIIAHKTEIFEKTIEILL